MELLTNSTVVDDAISFVASYANTNTHRGVVKTKADICILGLDKAMTFRGE